MKNTILTILLSLFLLHTLSAQDYTPASSGEIIHHTYYTLSYSEKNEQASWVYYKLTSDQVSGSTSRKDDFRPDPAVSTGSAQLFDYNSSGYDRGHLCPAADMKINATSMSESFFLSNMSPQTPSFNRGIWSTLEEAVRQVAKAYNTIYVVTGPVFRDCLGTIGTNHVTIPGYYYKVIYIPSVQTMLGFVLPNKAGNEALTHYAIPVDSIEALTNIDFFPQLDTTLQATLESSVPDEVAFIISPTSVETGHALSHSSTNPTSSDVANAHVRSKTIEGTTATQCKGIAKSTGQRCKSKTTNSNGYCNAHQSHVH